MNAKLFTLLICMILSFPAFGKGGQRSHSQDESPQQAIVAIGMFTPEILNKVREYAETKGVINCSDRAEWRALSFGFEFVCRRERSTKDYSIFLSWSGNMSITEIKKSIVGADDTVSVEKSDWRRFR